MGVSEYSRVVFVCVLLGAGHNSIYFISGFTHLALEDQATLIRLGQSSSRILVAAHQWFDAEQHRFRNFLPWRRDYGQDLGDVSTSNGENSDVTGDLFKRELVSFCDSIQQLQLDSVEAGLLNVLLIFATGMTFEMPKLVISNWYGNYSEIFHS